MFINITLLKLVQPLQIKKRVPIHI